MNSKLHCIIGLGNPGPNYAMTRHNVGFWLLDRLISDFHGQWMLEKKLHAHISQLTYENHSFKLVKPITYMNLSGKTVSSVLKYFNIEPSSVLIAHDDIDLEIGQLKLKYDGGHGGHNGLRNIFQATGNKGFHRARIGVGHPGDKDLVHDYVLKAPNKSHQNTILDSIDNFLSYLPDLFNGKFSDVTKTLHTRENDGI